MTRHRSAPAILNERNCSKEKCIQLHDSSAYYTEYSLIMMKKLTKVPAIAICGKLSTEKILSQSNISPWWSECPESRRSVAKDKENKVKHPMSRAISKPKMTGPPWLRACWMILCPTWFERKRVSPFDVSEAEPASSVVVCCELFQECGTAWTASKLPDTAVATRGMNSVFFHLSRCFCYSELINLLKVNIQILRFHENRCQRFTIQVSTCLNDKSRRGHHGWNVKTMGTPL